MSKKLVFPMIAVLTLGAASGALGCKAEMKVGNAEPKAATPPPPPPAPEPAPAPPPPPEPAPAPVIKSIGKAKIVNNEIQIPGKIQFEFDKATIKQTPETQEILKTLAQVMKENPTITKLRIEGHTDDKGGTDHNHKLSQSRAEAVAKWLTDNGVQKERLVTVGLGEEKPLVPNDNDAHREQNRRTEFKLWEMEGKPTAAATAAASEKPATPAADAKGADNKATPATPAKPADLKGGMNPATPATPATPAAKKP